MVLDSFEIENCGNHHRCLVHKPLWISLFDFQQLMKDKKFNEPTLKAVLNYLFVALDYLHTECQVIHTDIKTDNILQEIEDESILADFEKAEFEHPSPRKVDRGRTIYTTRKLGFPKTAGHPVLSDFGLARFGNLMNDDDIQPELYRAPEVILELKWSYSVDIRNVGVMIWDMFERKHMFNGIDPENKQYSNRFHLAEMVAYLGPPPMELLRRSDEYKEYFNEHGNWDGLIPIPEISFEKSEEYLDGKNKELFLQFMRKMLCWVPEERKTARELLQDPWLRGASA
ncbi:hypothetical protein MMC15_002419 [Xylographa vitiligo]|nr:hypothetical protein [Xylographa vitiligo]